MPFPQPIKKVNLLLALFAALLSNNVRAQWQQVGAANFTNSVNADFAINPVTGEPFLIYTQVGAPGGASAKKFDGQSWVNVGAANFTPVFTGNYSLAMHPVIDAPHLFFVDGSQGSRGSVMKFDGTSWVNVGVPGFTSSSISGRVFMSFSASGHPYVSARQYDGTHVYTFDGAAWVPVGGVIPDSDSDYLYHLAVNPVTQAPYIVAGRLGLARKLVVFRYDSTGNAWIQAGNAVPETNTTEAVLQFDPASTQPYLAYLFGSPAITYGINCRKLDSADWVQVGTPRMGYYGIEKLSFALDPVSRIPFISYAYSGPNVMKYDGYNWVRVGVLPTYPTPSGTKLLFHPQTQELYYQTRSGYCNVQRFVPCSVSDSSTVTACIRYARPENRGYYTTSGIYTDTVRSSTNCDSIATVNLTVIALDTSVTRAGNIWTANQAGAAYQWISCSTGDPVPGATGQSITITNGGAYAVEVTLNGCTGRSLCPMAVPGYPAPEVVQVSQHPGSGTITVWSPGDPPASVDVYHVSGRHLLRRTSPGKQCTIALDGAPGLYVLVVSFDDGRQMRYKILKLQD